MNQETNSKTHKKGGSQPMLRPSSTVPAFPVSNHPTSEQEQFACVVDDTSIIMNGKKQLGKSPVKLAQISIASKTRSKSKPKRSSTMGDFSGGKSPITISGPLFNHYSSSPETNDLSSINAQQQASLTTDETTCSPTSGASITPNTPYYENPSTFEYPNTGSNKNSKNKPRKSRTNSNPHAYKNRKIVCISICFLIYFYIE